MRWEWLAARTDGLRKCIHGSDYLWKLRVFIVRERVNSTTRLSCWVRSCGVHCAWSHHCEHDSQHVHKAVNSVASRETIPFTQLGNFAATSGCSYEIFKFWRRCLWMWRYLWCKRHVSWWTGSPHNPWVSNPWPVRLCYAARGHICKLYIYDKNYTLI